MSSRRVPATWTVSLTVHVHHEGPQTLRDWIETHCESRPRGFAAQLQWFIDCQLTSTADYDGVALSFDLADCHPVQEARS